MPTNTTKNVFEKEALIDIHWLRDTVQYAQLLLMLPD